MSKQYGFIPDQIDERDYTFAGVSNKKILQPDGQWDNFLPVFEHQRKNGVDTQGCVSFGVLSIIEILNKIQYGTELNLADRFLCKLSGTSAGGNSPRKVYKALKEKGAIKEELYPFNVSTWEEYYQEVPPELLPQGKEWTSKHSFSYSKVGTTKEEIKEALKYSVLGVGVYAWIKDGAGLYYKPEGARPNHFCVLIGYEEGKYWRIFDTYEESIKQLNWFYDFSYVCSYSLDKIEQNRVYSNNWLIDLILAFKRGR